DDVTAESVLRAALASCGSRGVEYPCLRLGVALNNALANAFRTSEARQLAAELAAQAAATGDWGGEAQALRDRAEAERLAMRLPTLRAVFEEIALHDPDDCQKQEYLRQ